MAYPLQLRETVNSQGNLGLEAAGAGPPELARVAAEIDERASSEVDLALTWRELVQGCTRIVGTFFSASRCGLVLAEAERAPELPLAGRRLEIIEAILGGASQNRVAIELAVAPSTIALNARLALEGLGMTGRPSRVHPLLMLAATVAKNRAWAPGALSFLHFGGRELRVVGIVRPDRRLVGVVPEAELDVAGCLVEGCCYAEIAERRNTSQRTIANQIATVFKRLRVSGRSELLQRLFTLQGALRPRLPSDPTHPPPSSPPPPGTIPPPSTVRYPRPMTLAAATAGSSISLSAR